MRKPAAAPCRIADLLAVPADAGAVRAAVARAEAIGAEAEGLIDALGRERSAALLRDDGDDALDRIDAALVLARRRADAADLAAAELRDRLRALAAMAAVRPARRHHARSAAA